MGCKKIEKSGDTCVKAAFAAFLFSLKKPLSICCRNRFFKFD
ncbi:hypothetical protein B4098_1270 [Heyndrickxia coagulans]|uniref:Uncharacterized protein n=1 Tax=Heyndrickxia coagulans TaxID=1398 RepID=A0A150KCC4_HEYCO|nr:hypothetical protein B4098_1270 [Heyndrickxia coagulans]